LFQIIEPTRLWVEALSFDTLTGTKKPWVRLRHKQGAIGQSLGEIAGARHRRESVQGALDVVLDRDYVRTARAKGLRQSAVVWRHGLHNALVPVITVLGIQAGFCCIRLHNVTPCPLIMARSRPRSGAAVLHSVAG
jgi:hypothetical protein